MMIGRLILAAVVATTALFTFATSASAATRYAAPTSVDATGTCAAIVPCRLDHAITGAASGDTVVVAPGTYSVTTAITAGQIVNIEGQAGQPRPRILGGAGLAGPTINNQKGG